MTVVGGNRFGLRRYTAAAERLKDAAVALAEAHMLLPDGGELEREVRAAVLMLNGVQEKLRAELDELTR